MAQLRKFLQTRGQTVQEFFDTMPGLDKYHDENLSLDEYIILFISCDFKVEDAYVRSVLNTFTLNEEGKLSYKDFIN